jgi:single-strand DNA-binding protein
MLKVVLSGNIGSDATVKEVGDKKAINFDVAVSKDYKNSNGEKVSKTEWVRAVIWQNKEGESKLSNYLKKGKKILIEGEPYSTGYKNKEGDIQSSLHVTVKDFEFLN